MEEQLSNIYEALRKQRVERFKDLDDNNPRKKSTIEGSTLKKYGSVIKTMYNSIFKDEALKPELFIKQQPKVMNYLETKYKDNLLLHSDTFIMLCMPIQIMKTIEN